MVGSRQIALGEADVVLAGGVESMSRAPWVLPKPRAAVPGGRRDAGVDHPRLAAGQPADAGGVDGLARRGHRAAARARAASTREAQDEFALRSHQLAAAAWDGGFYDDLVVAVPGVDLARDESIRPTPPWRSWPELKPSFRPDGTVTAGNASPLNDGASAVLLGSAAAGDPLGLDPLARIAGRGAARLEPQFFGFAPVEAANLALKRAGIGWADVGAVELNEAFAAQSLACVTRLGRRPRDREHPRRRDRDRPPARRVRHPDPRHAGRGRSRESGERWGVAAICIGVGQGLAVVLENAREG